MRRGEQLPLTASRRVAVLDHFRTPYGVRQRPSTWGIEEIRSSATGRLLLWPGAPSDLPLPAAVTLEADSETVIPLFATVVPDHVVQPMLSRYGRGWSPIATAVGADGRALASIWRREDGSLFLPFDPDEVQLNLFSESYNQVLEGRRARQRQLALLAYYRLRGLSPHPARIWLRRRYAQVQARRQFPRWPVETGLHDFWDFFYTLLQSLLDEPLPRIAAWPNAFTWALVLTHDVETSAGLAAIDPVLEVEQSLGWRSSWNFVPRRYEVTAERVQALESSGCEVGVHGLYHDGRDLESVATLRKRIPFMREAALRWGASGFRSPATHRGWNLMPMLGFDYDSSSPDTDPFEPQPGGCCTWLPFFNQGMVELPMTMAQDHTLFVILQHADEQVWLDKASFLRRRGGMALLDTHPDYLTDQRIFSAYSRFLEHFSADQDVWRALPREVSAWWRRRAESKLERAGSSWRVSGPAAEEVRIEFGPPSRRVGIAELDGASDERALEPRR